MKEALMMMGGGVMTDDLTAQAAHVRAGDTFYGAGSDDEQTGTLVDRSIPVGIIVPGAGDAALHTADAVRVEEASDGVVRVMLAPPVGDYPGGESGAYVGTLPSALGVTTDKIASGQTAAGVEGTYDADGTASESDMKAGIVAYSKGVRITGKQTDYGNVAKTLNAGESYNINEGFYGSGKISAASLASQQSAVVNVFGITANKVLEGNTIAGVAGTAPYIRKLNHKWLDNKSFNYPNTTTRDFTNLDEAHGNWYLANYPASNGGWLIIRVSCGTTDAEAEHRQMAWCTIGTNTWREIVLRPKYTTASGNYSTTVRLDFWRSANGDLYYHPMRGSTYGIFTTSIIVLAQTTVDLSQWS